MQVTRFCHTSRSNLQLVVKTWQAPERRQETKRNNISDDMTSRMRFSRQLLGLLMVERRPRTFLSLPADAVLACQLVRAACSVSCCPGRRSLHASGTL